MKRIIALVMSAVLLVGCLSLGFAASAAKSPAADDKITVMVKDGNHKDGVKITINRGETVKITASEATEKEPFKDWSFYKVSSKGKASRATEGVDYVLVESTPTSVTVTVKPDVDLIACANYGTKKTDVPDWNSGKSPKTGDLLPVVLAFVMLVSGGAVVFAKKRLAK